jgi:osmotically-inducible protein OsmY
MKSNEVLQQEVQDAIKYEPLLHAAEIGVIVRDGVVTLTGTVDSFLKKVEAETAAKNVAGVKAVAENIKIHFESAFIKNDTEIANEIINAWRWNGDVPDDKLKVKVENGWVTIEGQVEWNYEKEAAKKSVEKLFGVVGVSNEIEVKSNYNDAVEETAIQRAFSRSWTLNDNNIHVKVDHNNVKLTGTVSSLYQKDEAANLAWKTLGVTSVTNELAIT